MRRALLAAVCLIAAAAQAQAPPSFREGVLAFEKGEWTKAEAAMRATIAANPKETDGTVSIAGSWFETYVPHYFLARALAKQGKCAEALKEFAESERQGITPAIDDFARHLKTRGGCSPQAKEPKAPRPIADVTVPFGDEEQPKRAPDVVKPPPVKVPAKQPVKEIAPQVPAPAAPDIRARAEKTLLSAAVTAYLGGRYTDAARLLDSAQFTDRRLAAEVALFRAASRHALYRIGGEKDEALKALIDLDLQRYRALRGNSRPDPRIFPPSFLAMSR
jgi:tetratricopeptide (TPR) repeat protein